MLDTGTTGVNIDATQCPDGNRNDDMTSPLKENSQVNPFDRSGTQSMQAIVQTAYGGTEALRLTQVPLPPVPGHKEVLVRVHAAGVDRAVTHLLTGTPYLLRPLFGLRRPRNRVPGFDLAGRVVAVGSKVTHLRPGDDVLGVGSGSFAEYARARADQLVLRPRKLDEIAGAVCAMSGVTALQALRMSRRPMAGQDVLIIGASGGVGAYAVQLARCFGAKVTALCSEAKAEFVKTLGADRVLDYRHFDTNAHSRSYDTIIDIAGNRPLARLRPLLTEQGTLVIVGGEHADPWTGGLGRQLSAWLMNPFVRQHLVPLVSIVSQEDLRALAEHLADGSVVPPLDRCFPLGEAPRALDYLMAGHARGKVAIVTRPFEGSGRTPSAE